MALRTGSCPWSLPTARIETAKASEAGGILGEQIGATGTGRVVEAGSHFESYVKWDPPKTPRLTSEQVTDPRATTDGVSVSFRGDPDEGHES